MKNIAVIGTGYVGLVSGTCFSENGNKVICCDIDEDKISNLNKGIIPIYEPGLEKLVIKNIKNENLSFTTNISKAIQDSEVIYIAVGTPMSESGQANLKYVKEVAETIGENLNGYKVIVNKSTVPVGTGQIVKAIIEEHSSNPSIPFDVVSNPEFLREGSAIHDTMNMDRVVIGADNDRASKIIEDIHKPFKTNIVKTNIESAEMIKYASNAFLATKISFINEISNICEKVGADIEDVAYGMGLDSRIGLSFLNAGIGYGGSCFPKDTRALVQIAGSIDHEFELLKSVIKVNQKQQIKLVEQAQDIIGSLHNKRVGILGLAFKPNTDDMREAASLVIIEELMRQGANITAYDPVAIPNAKKLLPREISFTENIYEAITNCDMVFIVTEWEEIKNLPLKIYKELMRKPVVFDGRNCYNLEEAENNEIYYFSIGRKMVKPLELIY